ncbi:acyltransferase [Spongiibacter marinus]|uniref:acyltransferase n=1 Tax=Spongiibacter marinus TaxID=354246 RepID=UPI0006884AC1|nr:acyltransferase [Spongiibacter marinus]
MNKNIFEVFRILYFTPIALLRLMIMKATLNFNFNLYKSKSFGQYYGALVFRGRPERLVVGNYLRCLGNISFIFGNKFSGQLEIGNRVILEDGVSIAPRNGSIRLGDDVFVGPNVLLQSYFGGPITIGENVIIAKDTSVVASNHIISSPQIGFNMGEEGAEIVLEKNVWIGAGVKILAGSKIGEGTIVAAGAVVSGILEPFSIYGGVPAKKLKKYDLTDGNWLSER